MSVQQVPMLITFYGIASLVAAVIAYIVASAKHRDGSHWATISFLFPPAVLIPLPSLQRGATGPCEAVLAEKQASQEEAQAGQPEARAQRDQQALQHQHVTLLASVSRCEAVRRQA